jgi:hypothetical protein
VRLSFSRGASPLGGMPQPTVAQYGQQIVELVERLKKALHRVSPCLAPDVNTVGGENRST